MRLSRKSFVIILAALIVSSATIALGRDDSSLPAVQTPTVVQVCVQKGSGLVRLLTEEKRRCGPSETAADWTVGGDITAIEAGPGLTGGGEDGSVRLNVDNSAVQSRVAGSCTGSDAISSITQDGLVTCTTGGGQVIAGFNDGPGSIPDIEGATGGTLHLPPGMYAIFAKTWVSATPGGIPGTRVNCKLQAGSSSDGTEVFLHEGDWAPAFGLADDLALSASMSFMVVENLVHGGSVTLRCIDAAHFNDGSWGTGHASWNDVKIVAIKTSDLSNVFMGS